MNITDYIEECRKQRHDLSFAFLAERCPASEEPEGGTLISADITAY